MLQLIKIICALFGALLGFYLGFSFAVLFGFQTKIFVLLFAFIGACLCSVSFLFIYLKILSTRQVTGQFDLKHILLALLFVGLSIFSAYVLTIPAA